MLKVRWEAEQRSIEKGAVESLCRGRGSPEGAAGSSVKYVSLEKILNLTALLFLRMSKGDKSTHLRVTLKILLVSTVY